MRLAVAVFIGILTLSCSALAQSNTNAHATCESSASSMSDEENCYSNLVAKLQGDLQQQISNRNDAIAGLQSQGASEEEITRLQDDATKADVAWEGVTDAECGALAQFGQSDDSKFADLPGLKCKAKILALRIRLLQRN